MKFHLEAVPHKERGSVSTKVAVMTEDREGRLTPFWFYLPNLQGRMAARAMRDWLNAREVQ